MHTILRVMTILIIKIIRDKIDLEYFEKVGIIKLEIIKQYWRKHLISMISLAIIGPNNSHFWML